jgi:hypothetical protein
MNTYGFSDEDSFEDEEFYFDDDFEKYKNPVISKESQGSQNDHYLSIMIIEISIFMFFCNQKP